MYNVFLVDNDQACIEALKRLLDEYSIFGNIYYFRDPKLAYEQCKILKPNIVFLEIDLLGMNGLELAKKLLAYNYKIKVVFVTSNVYYAIDAYELFAIDYILKPVGKERLNKTIQRISNFKTDYYADDELTITTFGKLQVFNNTQYISWQGSKVEELFAFLLSNYSRCIHKDVIIDTLWEDYPYNRALGNMHTAVYRARKSLGELGDFCSITYNSNNYRVQVNHNVNFDLLFFYEATRKQEVTSDNWAQIIKGLEVYTNPFLEENGYLWAYAKQTLLERDYLATIGRLSDYFQNRKMHTEAYLLCDKLKCNYLFDRKIKNIFHWMI